MGTVDRLDRVEAASMRSVPGLEPMADSGLAAIRIARPHESNKRLNDAGGLRQEAADRGYLFFRQLIPAAEVLNLRARILETCRENGWLDTTAPIALGVIRPSVKIDTHDDVFTRLLCRVLPLPEFGVLREHPSITGILNAIYHGPFLSGCGDTCRVFPPVSHELTTQPHQDHFYVQKNPALWTVWIPLGDCPLELGALAVLPGSHKSGLRPHAGQDGDTQGIDVGPDAIWVSADYRCGDVLMFSCLTIHRALENRTPDRLRISADFRYQPAPVSV